MKVQVRDAHGKKASDNNEEEEDYQDKILRETGCKELNDAVLECFFDKKDWRACQSEVTAFKQCYMAYQERKLKEEQSKSV